MDWTRILELVITSGVTLAAAYLGYFVTSRTNRDNIEAAAREHEKDRQAAADEREKERQEKRRESKTELAVELRRADIKIVEDAVDDSLRIFHITQDIRRRRLWGGLSLEEAIAEFKSATFEEGGKLRKLVEVEAIAEKHAYSLGEEFMSEYSKLNSLLPKYEDFMIVPPSEPNATNDIDGKQAQIARQAGKLHSMLLDKLISIRDS